MTGETKRAFRLILDLELEGNPGEGEDPCTKVMALLEAHIGLHRAQHLDPESRLSISDTGEQTITGVGILRWEAKDLAPF